MLQGMQLPAQIVRMIVQGGNDTAEYANALDAKINTSIFAIAPNNDIYVIDNNCIKKIDHSNGKIHTVVGNGNAGTSNDGMPSGSSINQPDQVRYFNNEIYWIEGNRIRRLHAPTPFAVPVMNTVVGSITPGYSGDGSQAFNALLNEPSDFCFDLSGNMFIADRGNQVIRKVTPSGIISTIAGTGPGGTIPSSLEGLVANNTPIAVRYIQTDYNGKVHFTMGVGGYDKLCCILPNGNLHVEMNNGDLSAGGEFGYPPNQMGFSGATRFCFDTIGNAYIGLQKGLVQGNKLVRATVQNSTSNNGFVEWLNYPVSANANAIITYNCVAFDNNQDIIIGYRNSSNQHIICKVIRPKMKILLGTGTNDITADGVNILNGIQPAYGPQDVQFDTSSYCLYYNEYTKIRKINAQGILSTVAGNGNYGTQQYHIPNGSLATSVPITFAGASTPFILGPHHSIYFFSSNSRYIYKIDSLGIITTIAGNGDTTNLANHVPALSTGLGYVSVMAWSPSGELYFADENLNKAVIHRIDTSGITHIVAGPGLTNTDTANNLLATDTYLESNVNGLAFDSLGNLYYSTFHKIRKIDHVTQLVTTYAGTGDPTTPERPSADKLEACLNYPYDLFFDQGNLYVSEYLGNRIRKITDRTYTYAGASAYESIQAGSLFNNHNTIGFCCNDGFAELATMNFIPSICKGTGGNMFLTDWENSSIRMIYEEPNQFNSFPSDTTITTPSGCSTTYSYTIEAVNGAQLSYQFTGATLGSGNGTGSGSVFNIGVTTVTIYSNLFGFQQIQQSFTVTVTGLTLLVTGMNNIAIPSGSTTTSLVNGTNLGVFSFGDIKVLPCFKISSPDFVTIDSIIIDGVDKDIVDSIWNFNHFLNNSSITWNLMIQASMIGVFEFNVKVYINNCNINPYSFRMKFEVQPQTIDQLELVINNDPGFGNGLSTTVSNANQTIITLPANTLQVEGGFLQFSLPANLATGYQNLCIRAKNSMGVWSVSGVDVVDVQPELVTEQVQAEFFLDNDPGLGNALPITLTTNSGTLNTNDLYATVSSIASGYHPLHIRCKNNLGLWTPVSTDLIDANPSSNSQVALEFVFDASDPGPGNGIPFTLNSILDSLNMNLSQLIPCLTNGQKIVKTRVQNNLGIWSALSKDTFVVNGIAAPTITASDTALCNGAVTLYRSVKNATGVIDAWKQYNNIIALGSDSLVVNTAGNYTMERACPAQPSVNSNTVIVVTSNCNDELNIGLFLQGFMDVSGTMVPVLATNGLSSNINETDSINIELRDAGNLSSVLFQNKTILSTTGQVTLQIPHTLLNTTPFYIVIKHRNHVETWSAQPILAQSNMVYDFSNQASKAYGDNQIEVQPNVFAIYSGDINQDGSIDAFDYLNLEPDITAGEFGYLITDLNGDSSVDILDYLILDPNISNGIGIQAPY